MEPLDIEVAEKVMGWKLYNHQSEDGFYATSPEHYEEASSNDGWSWVGREGHYEAWMFKPSTEHDTAMEVVGAVINMIPDTCELHISGLFPGSGDDAHWEASFETWWQDDNNKFTGHGVGDSPAEAICRAALAVAAKNEISKIPESVRVQQPPAGGSAPAVCIKCCGTGVINTYDGRMDPGENWPGPCPDCCAGSELPSTNRDAKAVSHLLHELRNLVWETCDRCKQGHEPHYDGYEFSHGVDAVGGDTFAPPETCPASGIHLLLCNYFTAFAGENPEAEFYAEWAKDQG